MVSQLLVVGITSHKSFNVNPSLIFSMAKPSSEIWKLSDDDNYLHQITIVLLHFYLYRKMAVVDHFPYLQPNRLKILY